MKRLRTSLPLILCGPLLVLTYFLVQGTIPAPARHEATLAALRGLVLNNAALQRDVLRARAGLLRSYDPLVESVADLRRSAAALVPAVEIATGEAQTSSAAGSRPSVSPLPHRKICWSGSSRRTPCSGTRSAISIT